MEKIFNMRQTPSEINGLIELINYTKLNNIVMVEIGSFTGESSVIFAKQNAVKTLYCIDPWVGGYDSDDKGAMCDFTEVERLFDERTNKYTDKIIKIKNTSTNAINYFIENDIKVDLVYIDGNHQEHMVTEDINNYKQIIKEGMFISGHDWQHLPVRRAVEKTIGGIDEKFKDNSWIKKIT